MKIGVSAGFLSSLLSGKKKLSDKTIPKLIEYLSLDKKEKDFFILLVKFSDSDNFLEKSAFEKKLRILKATHTNKNLRPDKVKSNIGWTDLYLLSAINLYPEKEKLISYMEKALKLSKKIISDNIETLKKEGLIKEENNRLIQIEKGFIFNAKSDQKLLKEIHKDYLRKNIDLIDSSPSSKRYSVTEFSITNPNDFNLVKKITNEYLDELSQITTIKETNSKNSILGLSLHLNIFNSD